MTGTSLFFITNQKARTKEKNGEIKMKEKKLDDLETCTFCWYLEDWSKLSYLRIFYTMRSK
jgi:hypothetical protein